ncbi:MAG: TadE/TadG family type IV pilus assembly protein [Candidatus Binatus sp.]
MNIRGTSLPLAGRPAGQTLTEFAMTATVFLLLLFGISEIALAVNAYNSMSTAAHEAARVAMVHSPTSANSPCPKTGACGPVTQQAVNYAPFLATTDVSLTWTDSSSATLDYAVVSITHTYPLSIPFMPSFNLQLKADSKMLVSQ